MKVEGSSAALQALTQLKRTSRESGAEGSPAPVRPEELVIKHSRVSAEERMQQMLSGEDLKRLLFMMVPFSPRSEDESGRLVDVKS